MREITLMRKFEQIDENLGRVGSWAVGCESRVRVWEQMATKRGGMLWLILRNIFAPEGLRLEVIARFKKMSEFTPEKPKDDIEIVTVKSDEELQAELAKGGAK